MASSASKSKYVIDLGWDKSTNLVITMAWLGFFALDSAVNLFLSVRASIDPGFGEGALNASIISYRDSVRDLLRWVIAASTCYHLFKNAYYIAYAPIKVRNSTDAILIIRVDGRRIGEARPKKIIRNNRALKGHEAYLIEAVDGKKEIVYSREYRSADLEDMGWEITVPPVG
jgi:hypothetical protein